MRTIMRGRKGRGGDGDGWGEGEERQRERGGEEITDGVRVDQRRYCLVSNIVLWEIVSDNDTIRKITLSLQNPIHLNHFLGFYRQSHKQHNLTQTQTHKHILFLALKQTLGHKYWLWHNQSSNSYILHEWDLIASLSHPCMCCHIIDWI